MPPPPPRERERAGEKKGMCLQLFYFFFEHLPLADRNVSSVWVQLMGRYFQITCRRLVLCAQPRKNSKSGGNSSSSSSNLRTRSCPNTMWNTPSDTPYYFTNSTKLQAKKKSIRERERLAWESSDDILTDNSLTTFCRLSLSRPFSTTT